MCAINSPTCAAAKRMSAYAAGNSPKHTQIAVTSADTSNSATLFLSPRKATPSASQTETTEQKRKSEIADCSAA